MTSPRPSSTPGSSAFSWREANARTSGRALAAAISRSSHSGSAKASGFRRASQRPRAARAPWFAETWSRKAMLAHGVDTHFVQDNQAFNARRGTVRGLHFQKAPHAQGKLVRVLKGAIYDVAVDVRQGSPTYGRWVGATLTAET